jgi:exodeoxyribonuclease VII small subunit
MEQPTFRAAYDVRQKHAEILRQQKEPNIDDLLKIVTESVATYNSARNASMLWRSHLKQRWRAQGSNSRPGRLVRSVIPQNSDTATGEPVNVLKDDDQLRAFLAQHWHRRG